MTADAMTTSLDKIRARTHAPVDPAAVRLIYATFPPGLKAAMKLAATRNGWDRETWALQTDLIQTSLLAGSTSETAIIAGYTQPPREAP